MDRAHVRAGEPGQSQGIPALQAAQDRETASVDRAPRAGTWQDRHRYTPASRPSMSDIEPPKLWRAMPGYGPLGDEDRVVTPLARTEAVHDAVRHDSKHGAGRLGGPATICYNLLLSIRACRGPCDMAGCGEAMNKELQEHAL